MSPKTLIREVEATVCLTSCGRPALLFETVDSFLRFHDPERFLIVEDSADADFVATIRRRYPGIEVIGGDVRRGQFAAIDLAYALISSPHVLHLEDDWRFDGPVPFAAALGLIARRPDVAMVSVRAIAELNPKYQRLGVAETEEEARFLVLPPAIHATKFGYSFNPGVAPMAIWRNHGPLLPHYTEMRFSKHVKDAGLTMAYALPGVARHIGDGLHVGDPFSLQPESNPLKRWYGKARRLFDPMYGR